MVVALNVAKTLTESQNQQDDVRLVEEALFRSCRRACPTGESDQDKEASSDSQKMKSLEDWNVFEDREMMLERT